MLAGVPDNAFVDMRCARCDLGPGHAADLVAFADGHTWTWRNLPGARFAVCAACRAIEVAELAAFNVTAWNRLRELGGLDGSARKPAIPREAPDGFEPE